MNELERLLGVYDKMPSDGVAERIMHLVFEVKPDLKFKNEVQFSIKSQAWLAVYDREYGVWDIYKWNPVPLEVPHG